MDHMAAVEKDRAFEKAVRNEMKNRQGEGSQTAFHDHIAHLADGRVAQRFFNVVLCEHHARPQNCRKRSRGEDQMQYRRAEAIQRSETVQEEPSGIDDPGM